MPVKGFDDTIAWYNNNAKQYATEEYKVPPHELIQQFIDLLPQKPLVLDAGCGAGRDAGLLTKKGAQVIGLDISEGLLDIARGTYPTISFIQGSFLALPYTDNFFDGIWAHASLVHLERVRDVKTALKEFYRVLKKKGIIHIYVKAQTGLSKTAIVADSVSHHERFFRYFTESELTTYLTAIGFTIQNITILPDPHGRQEVTWICIFAEK